MWCPIIPLGQVMTRLRLDWLARPLTAPTRYSTCATVTAICALPWLFTLVYFVGTIVPDVLAETGKENGDNDQNDEDDDNTPTGAVLYLIVKSILVTTITIWQCFLLCQTRREIRRRDNIREECCCSGDCEDCCCACCCPHLAIYQINRHTGDFTHQRAVCCNATGLMDRPTRQLPPVMV